LVNAATVHDYLIGVGRPGSAEYQKLRLVEVYYEGTWYRYMTNVLDLAVLSGAEIAWLYRQRWRIESAFKTVKRLLGLAYFHGSSVNAVELQL
jgi:IS4 transposase